MENIILPDGVFNDYHIELAETFFGVVEWKHGVGGRDGRDGFKTSVYGINENGQPIIDVTFDSSGHVSLHDIRDKPIDFKIHIEASTGVGDE